MDVLSAQCFQIIGNADFRHGHGPNLFLQPIEKLGLDDIAWLLNIRGNDVPCNPVVLSYAVITRNEFYLFIHEKTLDQKVNSSANRETWSWQRRL